MGRGGAGYLTPHHELFQHPAGLPAYNPYTGTVKDEPLRGGEAGLQYPGYYHGYPDLVNPYVHMTRREKRKKADSLPGGNTLTRDERKVGDGVALLMRTLECTA